MPKVPLYRTGTAPLDFTYPRARPYPSAEMKLAGHFVNFGSAAHKFFAERQSRKDRLFLLSKMNDVQHQRIDELLNLREQHKEKDAQGLIDSERERVTDGRDDFLDGVPNYMLPAATQVYNSANAQYLGRVASHEYSEFENWRNTEKSRAITAAQGRAMSLDLGNLEGLFDTVRELRGKLEDFPIDAEIAGKDTIISTYAFWARMQPKMAEKVLTENNAVLQKVMGKEYNRLLIALETGKVLHERERERVFRWSERGRVIRQENTMKGGVDLFIDPAKELDTGWIIANEDNLSSTQMRILYSLMGAQNSQTPMTEDQADFAEYYRLSKLVRDRKARGYNFDTVADQIIPQIEQSITAQQGKSLLNKLTSDVELTPEQARAYRMLESMKFHRQDARMNAYMKYKAMEQLDLWIERHPTDDPGPYLEKTLFQDQKDDLQDYWHETFGAPYEPGEAVLQLQEGEPFATMDEEMQVFTTILQLQKKYPEANIKNTPAVQLQLLRALRRTYPSKEGKR